MTSMGASLDEGGYKTTCWPDGCSAGQMALLAGWLLCWPDGCCPNISSHAVGSAANACALAVDP